MNISHLFSEILRGLWAIDPQYALAQEIFVTQLLTKENPSLGEAREEMNYVFASQDSPNLASNSSGDIPEGSVGIVSMSGAMLKYGTLCSYGTTEIVPRLSYMDNHPNIIGNVFVVDSPGGAVNAIAPLQQFQATRKKPLVALVDVGASAAYYAIAGSDYIMADNTISSAFGSIGVVASFMDLKPYYEKLGAKVHTVYAPESTHKNLPFENALKGEYDALKVEILSPLAVNFQNYVKENRKNLKLDTEGILNGKMFYAKEAVEVGLCDAIGDMRAALKKVQELAELKNFMSN
jgi:protease-4